MRVSVIEKSKLFDLKRSIGEKGSSMLNETEGDRTAESKKPKYLSNTRGGGGKGGSIYVFRTWSGGSICTRGKLCAGSKTEQGRSRTWGVPRSRQGQGTGDTTHTVSVLSLGSSREG